MKSLSFLIALFAIAFFTGCNNSSDLPKPSGAGTTVGTVEIMFEDMVGDEELELLTKTYLNAHGDSFNVTTFKYYISNIQMKRSDGFVYAETESYHLIEAGEEHSHLIHIGNVPTGHYEEISFMIGVDSARNVSGSQTGALDPVHNMFWSWSSGYIMVKMEGTSPTAPSGNLKFHIGGFTGANSVLTTKTWAMHDPLIVESKWVGMVHFRTDLAEMFKNPSTVDFSMMHTVHMPGTMAKTIGSNYADMFEIEHVHNYTTGHSH